MILLDYFNSRPRKEVDDVRSVVMEYFTAFQLTTSQGGRHILLNRNTLLRCISTHDLARRSTLKLFHFLARNAYFNSRPRKEVDTASTASSAVMDISTHDLARRSTAIFTQKVFLSKSLFVLIAYNIFILY